MDKTTRRLVDFALSVRLESLSSEAVVACKRSIVDSFGCALAGFSTPLAHQARSVARRYAGAKPGATVWGCDWETSADMAAFANGIMLRLLDLSDAYRCKSGGHPSDMLGALVATAQAQQAPGPSLIAAMAASYEVYCGLCDSIDLNSLGWDQPVYGAVATAIGCGMLLGLDGERLGHAVGLSLVSGMALVQTRRGRLSSWKNCAGPHAARQGLFAAQLAYDGFTGPDQIFEGQGGLFQVVGPFEWRLPAADGQPWRVTLVNLKNYPLCYHGQAAVHAALQLQPRIAAADINAVEVEVYAQAHYEMANEPSKWAPRTAETADHSLPYVVAAALVDGSITPASFAPTRLDDPRLARLMSKTTVRAADDLSSRYPTSAPARLQLRLANGHIETAHVASAPGHADNPMPASTLRTKFVALSTPTCDAVAAERFLDQLEALERVENVGGLLELISGAEKRSEALAGLSTE